MVGVGVGGSRGWGGRGWGVMGWGWWGGWV